MLWCHKANGVPSVICWQKELQSKEQGTSAMLKEGNGVLQSILIGLGNYSSLVSCAEMC